MPVSSRTLRPNVLGAMALVVVLAPWPTAPAARAETPTARTGLALFAATPAEIPAPSGQSAAPSPSPNDAPPADAPPPALPPPPVEGYAVAPPYAPSPAATTPPAAADEPFYQKWWFWTAVGAFAVTTIVIVLASSSPSPPKTDLGNMPAF